jgi:hypothetical protein
MPQNEATPAVPRTRVSVTIATKTRSLKFLENSSSGVRPRRAFFKVGPFNPTWRFGEWADWY